jgi:effector-binding domain-containing protein
MKKALYWLLGIIGVIILLWVLACFLAPKNLDVKKEQSMKAPANMVYNLVSDLGSWEQWSSWNLKDTSMQVTYGDITKGLGAKSSWVSATQGSGTQEFIEVVAGEKIRSEMHFEGMSDANYASFFFEEKAGMTSVIWDMDGADMPFLIRPMNWYLESEVSKSYAEGLSNLKNLVEKRASEKIYDGYKVKELLLEERYFLINRQEVPLANISQFYQQNLGALFSKMQKAGLTMAGMPCGLFFKYDIAKGMTDMAAGLPMTDPVDIADASSITTPSGRALQVDYLGDYAGTEKAHAAIEKYMEDYNLLNNPPVIEEYLTDPGTEKDPNKWLTRITYFIAE